MRLQIVSDLHFEFSPDGGQGFIDLLPVVGDVLVLAGDIHLARSLRSVVRRFAAKWPYVIAVVGEREYFHTDPVSVVREIMAIECELSNVAYLNNGSTITIKGQRFIGGTLWFPEQKDNILYQGSFETNHSWVYDANHKMVQALQRSLHRDDVLVTHHLPSEKCLRLRDRASPLWRFSFTSLDSLLQSARPKLAVCGRAHTKIDVVVGGTRVVCNPLGYPCEEAIDFNPVFVVEV